MLNSTPSEVFNLNYVIGCLRTKETCQCAQSGRLDMDDHMLAVTHDWLKQDLAQITCFGCSNKGHYQANCPTHPRQTGLAPPPTAPNKPMNKPITATTTTEEGSLIVTSCRALGWPWVGHPHFTIWYPRYEFVYPSFWFGICVSHCLHCLEGRHHLLWLQVEPESSLMWTARLSRFLLLWCINVLDALVLPLIMFSRPFCCFWKFHNICIAITLSTWVILTILKYSQVVEVLTMSIAVAPVFVCIKTVKSWRKSLKLFLNKVLCFLAHFVGSFIRNLPQMCKLNCFKNYLRINKCESTCFWLSKTSA